MTRCDTGGSLYHNAQREVVTLFRESYPALDDGRLPRQHQDLQAGSLHKAREPDPDSRIGLIARYTARELLNRLRARTFGGHPACRFDDGGDSYEVRTDIRRFEK